MIQVLYVIQIPKNVANLLSVRHKQADKQTNKKQTYPSEEIWAESACREESLCLSDTVDCTKRDLVSSLVSKGKRG